ncbi:MAG TPA: DNA-binding protein [Cyanobacteria bacterium UBA11049]|nr:DNA-binding protein [Cyanobacteria bacterium UBA11049]
MTKPSATLEPVFATEKEARVIKSLDIALKAKTKNYAKLVGTDGQEIVLPESVYSILRQVVHLMASGRAVSIVPLEHELTTQEAADLLNVSRPFLVKLLEQGEIPYIKVGSHRRIQFEDLTAYKQRRDRERRQNLRELTQFSQDEGFYEAEELSG